MKKHILFLRLDAAGAGHELEVTIPDPNAIARVEFRFAGFSTIQYKKSRLHVVQPGHPHFLALITAKRDVNKSLIWWGNQPLFKNTIV